MADANYTPGRLLISGQDSVIAMRMRWIRLAAGAALLLCGSGARADELALFNAAMEDVAAHNRVALGDLRTENVDLATVELERMKDAWGAFAERFGGSRPAPFRDNKLYVAMLVDVPTRIVTAMIMVNFGRPDVARNSLQAIREELTAMRRESGVEVMADCVLDANAAMDALFVYRDPPDWDRPATPGDIAAKADAYGASVKRCDAMALAPLRTDPEFRRLVDGVAASLAFVPKAVAARDGDLLHRVIVELRSFDNLLAFRYG
jgi:hypothetical protein